MYRNIILIGMIVSFLNCKSSQSVFINEINEITSIDYSGKVIDASTKLPISKAVVRVENSSIVEKTDSLGVFHITNLPISNPRLSIEKEGYGYFLNTVQFNNVNSELIKYELETELIRDVNQNMFSDNLTDLSLQIEDLNNKYFRLINNIQDSIVNNEENELLEDFEKYYILSRKNMTCSIVDPTEIVLTRPKAGSRGLDLENRVEFLVLNKELGYLVTVRLENFIARDYETQMSILSDASFSFQELIPSGVKEEKKWIEARDKLFYGSLSHFLIALSSDKPLITAGFKVFIGTAASGNESSYGEIITGLTDIEVSKDKFVMNSSSELKKVLNSTQSMRVEYLNRDLKDEFKLMGLKGFYTENSWITLNKRLVEFYINGMFENPSDVNITGYWAYEKICDMLPQNYIPTN